MSRHLNLRILALAALFGAQSVQAGTLATIPLNQKQAVPSNVIFSLSVEFPTAITAAYPGASDYDAAKTYLGIFDSEKCYDYSSANGWFYPTSTATSHNCTGHWSGNLLNWASMTGLDEFRVAMTGGNRYQDTASLTVLERSYQSNQGSAGSNFADKTYSGTTGAPYSGEIKIKNWNKGVQMNVTGPTSTQSNDSGSCSNAKKTGGFSCDVTLASTSEVGSCTTPSGSGTSGDPYYCSAISFTTAGAASSITHSNLKSSGSGSSKWYYYKDYNFTVTTTSSAATNYNVRAKVCDSSIGLEANCTPYGTTYKPTGSIQKYGNTMRFGVFSYYNAEDIDNAVMRSAAKYVAPNKWTPSGATSNANMEWSATDGTFISNPDPTVAANSHNGAVNNSGVINYINKFGSNSHSYKKYDNVGKLYYETLKYLRGITTPTAGFYENSSTANNDDFPVISSWSDPVEYACQKNFVIAMGDTHTHCDKRLPGNTITPYGSSQCAAKNGQVADQGDLSGDAGINVNTWTGNIGTLESVANLATKTFSGTASYHMSGLAYWAAYNGFRTFPGASTPMKLQTYVIDVQEKVGGVTDLGVNSQYWYAAKYGGATRFNADGSPYDATTTPTSGIPTTDSWWTTNSQPLAPAKWPKALLPASNPDLMKKAVDGAFADIAKQSAIDSAAGVSSGELGVSTGTDVFTTSYSSDNWYGDVLSYHINGTLGVSTTPTWKASTYLNPTTLNPSSGTPPWKTRRVISFNDGLEADGSASTATNGRRGVQFKATQDTGTNLFTTSFSPRQQALLSQDPGAAASADGVGSDRVDYLRGDNSNEGNKGELWRSRSNSLGDLIHSSAVYVRFPTFSNIPGVDATTYKAFASAIASRTPVVYAGANDGMLHAFNASDLADDGMSSATDIGATADSGKEMLAYVPAAVYGKLSQLTSTAYAHQYYVDSTPVIADAQLGSPTCTASSDTYKCWRTIVAGGLKAGGQGIYALDGTNPGNFATANANSLVLWEFTDRDDADLGYTFSTPLIRKMNNGKWAVIFGNGYNNTEADGSASSDGRAYLYILMLDGPGTDASTGRGNTWTQDTNYFKIKLNAPGEGSTTKLSPANGLSNVQGIDKNNDNIVDYLYAGDRYGNIWKVDVSSTNPANWKSAFGTAANPDPLFTAVTSETTPAKQQVTTSPLVVASPNGGYMVMFGTGSFIDDSDKNSPFTLESFYGIWDKDDGTTKVTGRSQLQKQATLAYNSTVGYNLLSNCAVQYSSTATPPSTATTLCPSSLSPSVNGDSKVDQQLGWVLDLNFSMATTNPGERYISDPLPTLSNGLLTFVTLTPSADVCDPSYTSFEYNLNYLTGGSDGNAIYFNFPTGGGTPTAITTGFSVNGSTVTTNPSGRKISGGGAGQNPAGISARGTNPYDSATSGTGCNPFVAGRACRNPNWDCTVTPGSPPSVSCRKGTPTGEISWRQITN